MKSNVRIIIISYFTFRGNESSIIRIRHGPQIKINKVLNWKKINQIAKNNKDEVGPQKKKKEYQPIWSTHQKQKAD